MFIIIIYSNIKISKSPKSKTRPNVIRDSGKIPNPYSPTLGRRRPVGTWKAKKKEEEQRKTQRGKFSQETIEEELNKYKKGVFMFDDESKKDINGTAKKAKRVQTSIDAQYSKYQLTKTQKPPPKYVIIIYLFNIYLFNRIR